LTVDMASTGPSSSDSLSELSKLSLIILGTLNIRNNVGDSTHSTTFKFRAETSEHHNLDLRFLSTCIYINP
jgi:hypothetical protein